MKLHLGAVVLPLLLLVMVCADSMMAGELEAVSVGGIVKTLNSSRSKRAAGSVKDKTKKQLTQSDREAFILAHNTARAGVAPTATNMPFMTWNSTLENLAQRWALGCAFEHGNVETPYAMGQNLWAGTGGYVTNGAVETWDNEKSDYTYSDNTCEANKACGHHTQVVWAKSTEVGCGIAFCDDMQGFKQDSWIIVCNYVKPGNYRGVKPYVDGVSCSDCPEGFTQCNNKLCRKEPMCDGLTCNNGKTMNTTTCLCACGSDPKNEKGPFCGEHPVPNAVESQSNKADESGSGSGSGPTIYLNAHLLTAILAALVFYSSIRHISH